ncbi:PIN domain-containing protein [Pseudogemmobacter sp. W21_MBD1_M6]|uniref:PIN domain-containing protein n=1 Tax=Pseudogemmobacter sp. W21_MBD1_M6 TaxID=3240271 RepID=UPI003F97A910
MTKIEKPGKGTKITETTRVAAETGMSLLPGGGIFNSFARWLLPSKLDKQKAGWQESVTQATNQQGQDVKELKKETAGLRLEQFEIVDKIEDTRGRVDALASKLDVGVIDADPLDGELEICRSFVLGGKFQTALDLLSERFEDNKRSNQIPPKLMARVRSLQGMCLKSLGKYDEAAEHFLTALRIDPDSPKIRANAVVGYLIAGDTGQATKLLEKLIDEEPNTPMHWANLIYTKSAQGEVLDRGALPGVISQSKDVCLALVDAKRANSDDTWLNDAVKCAALYPESTRAKRHEAEAAINAAVQAVVMDVGDPAAHTAIMERAATAATELEQQWETHLGTEASKSTPDLVLLQNTLVAHRVTGNRLAAEALIVTHTDLLLTDKGTTQVLGAFAIETRNDALLDRVLTRDFEGAAVLKIERALRDEAWGDALEICETYPEEIGPSGRIDPEFMSDVLRVMTGPEGEKEEGFRGIYQRSEATSPQRDLFLSQMIMAAGFEDLSAEVFDRAANADLVGDAEIRRALAGEAMDRDIPEIVIKLLRDHVDPSQDGRARNWLAMSYARTSVPYESGILFFAAVRKAGDNGAEINRAGGHFHLNRRKPDEASPWLKRSLVAEPNSVRTQLAFWQALSRDGAAKRAKKFLETVDLAVLEGPKGDRMGMAQLLWRNGRADALEYAYDLTSRNRNDFKVCLGYSGLMLGDAFDSDAPQIPSTDVVAIGSMVKLTRPHNNDWSIVITEAESDLQDHVSIDNPIVQGALGKHQGDTFETFAGPNTFVWTVSEIKSKYLHLFHEITRTLQDQFPNNGSFYSVTMVGDDVTPLLKSLRERRSSIERLEDQYRDNPMPLGAMAKAGGDNVIDFAIHLAQSGKQVFSATGYAADTERELSIAIGASERIVVIDAYTVWLMAKLEMLQPAKEVFPNLTVPASTIDDFSEMIEEMGDSPDGRKSMSAQGDGFTIQELSADEVTMQATGMEKLRDQVAAVCNIVGIEVPSGMSVDLLRLADFLGGQFDCLSVVEREDGILLSADLRLRQVATDICNKEAFGMDALLRTLVAEQAISVEAYGDVLLRLCALGHSYVAFNELTLMRMLMCDDTPDLQRFSYAAAYLGTPNADVASHVTTAAEFARRAFTLYPNGTKARCATSKVLQNLIRMNGLSLAQIVSAFVQHADHPRLTQYVLQWLRGHFLLETYERQIEAERASSV